MAEKSKDDVIKALKICSLGDKKFMHNCSCSDCPYKQYTYGAPAYKGTNCNEEMMKDALEYPAWNNPTLFEGSLPCLHRSA